MQLFDACDDDGREDGWLSGDDDDVQPNTVDQRFLEFLQLFLEGIDDDHNITAVHDFFDAVNRVRALEKVALLASDFVRLQRQFLSDAIVLSGEIDCSSIGNRLSNRRVDFTRQRCLNGVGECSQFVAQRGAPKLSQQFLIEQRLLGHARFAAQTFVLKCGWEQAVAATKSVAEQALFYQELLAQLRGATLGDKLGALADAIEAALTGEIDSAITQSIADAGTIYFAGKNDGVAEELTLKTNEITRKKSDFLEGTYAVHGIEEVMDSSDVVIVIDPFEEELEKFKETLVDGVGLNVVVVSTEPTIFPTIVVTRVEELQNFVFLAAGWNILIEVGIRLGVNLDKAERARKVGNEFTGA